MWHEYSAAHTCIQALSSAIEQAIQERLRTEATCTVAVSGGRSPIPLFEHLSNAALDWSRVELRLVDERYVPPGHPDSNEGLVRRHLLINRAAAACFRGLYVAGAGVDEAVSAANEDMHGRKVALALLGMGDDGHTASLFPGAPQLEAGLAPDAACYLHVTPPEAAHERISMSLAALRTCPRLLLHISGDHKREVLGMAARKVDKNLPISFLVAEPGVSLDVHWHP